MTYLLLKKVSNRDAKSDSPDENNLKLQLARVVLFIIVPILGFFLTSYLHMIDKSIEKLSDRQDDIAVMTARIDEAVKNIDKRLDRIEKTNP